MCSNYKILNLWKRSASAPPPLDPARNSTPDLPVPILLPQGGNPKSNVGKNQTQCTVYKLGHYGSIRNTGK